MRTRQPFLCPWFPFGIVLALFLVTDRPGAVGQEGVKSKKDDGPTPEQKKLQLLARGYDLAIMGRENRWPEALVLSARMLRLAEVEFERDLAPYKTVRPGKEAEGPKPSFSAEQPREESEHLLEEALRMSRGTKAAAGIESFVAAVKEIASTPKVKIRQFVGILKPEQRNIYKVPVEKGRSTLIYLRASRFDAPLDLFIQDGGSTTISARRPYVVLFAYPIIEHTTASTELSIAVSNLGTAATAYQMIVK